MVVGGINNQGLYVLRKILNFGITIPLAGKIFIMRRNLNRNVHILYD